MSNESDDEPSVRDVYIVHGQVGALGPDAQAVGNIFEETHGERPPSEHREASVAPSRLTHSAAKLFGRENELARLEEAWNDPKTHVVTLVAWGGVGKTSLVAAWAAELAARDYDGADYFDWSFYSQGTRERGGPSSDAFVNAALEFFGDVEMAESTASGWDKGARLARLVGQRRTLLVLDGLEPLQHPPGAVAGKLKDPALEALLKGLAAQSPGLCLVMTRESVVDLERFHDTTAPEWKLGRLSTLAGVGLLKTLGVHGAEAELEELVADVDGHALTLKLLGQYLNKAHGGDVRRRDRVKLEKADRKTQGGHAFKAMAAYEAWLAEGGEDGERQLAVLRLLSLFDRPADYGCMSALRRDPVVVGLTEPLVDLDEDDWNLTLSDLSDCGLVSKSPTEETSLDAHPLIREFFARQLREQNPDAWRAAHGRIFDHLQESTEHRPDTLEGLQPLYQAVNHGCRAGRQQEACDKVYRDRIDRGLEFYSTNKLGAFGADLGAVACFFETPWSRVSPLLTEADRAWLLSQAAFRLRALGRLTEAFEPMRAGLQGTERLQNWKGAAIYASNLSELELTVGDIDGAVRDAELSVVLADRSSDAAWRMLSRAVLADTLHQAGEQADALEHFCKAEEIQADRQSAYPLLYSFQGFRYCDLLLADAERAAWQTWSSARAPSGMAETSGEIERRAAQTLEIAVQNKLPLLTIALDHLTLGRAKLYRALLDRHDASDGLKSEIEQAVDGLRRAGTLDHLPRGLLTRAWFHAFTDNPAAAHADLNEAQEIAEHGPMPLYLANIHLHRARLFRDKDALPKARHLIEKHGYGRRLDELGDAEKAAEHWT